MFVIKGRILTCENNTVIEKGIVVTDGDKIVFAGEEKNWRTSKECTEISYNDDVTIMPGFIDCHTHLTGTESGKYDIGKASTFDRLINAVDDMGVLLDSGFTTVRDMSLFSASLKKGVERGKIKGPKVFPGGRLLGITSGHSDGNSYFPVEYLQKEDPTGYIVNGIEGCLRGVREQFREGAEFIKVCATGGVSSMTDGLDDVQFSMEELKTIVDEAKRKRTYVAAHCSGTEGTYQCLQAGVTSIEHGIMLDERCIELMVKNNATLVPTLSISLGIPTYKGLPDYMIEKGKRCAQLHLKSIEKARKADIRIAYGTDFSNSENTPYRKNGMEFHSLVKAGLTPYEAIKAGTVNSAHLVFGQGKIGMIKDGMIADIVVSKGNPLKDISILTNSDNILAVIKDGVLVKKSSVGRCEQDE